MNTMIRRLLGLPTGTSGHDAKQRLKVLLLHDEVDLPPAKLQMLKAEILEVVARYIDVEEEAVVFKLSKEEGEVSLVSSLPVRRVHAKAS